MNGIGANSPFGKEENYRRGVAASLQLEKSNSVSVVLLSKPVADDFDDGETYREYDHERIWVPSHIDERPSREFLEWHNDMVFLA